MIEHTHIYLVGMPSWSAATSSGETTIQKAKTNLQCQCHSANCDRSKYDHMSNIKQRMRRTEIASWWRHQKTCHSGSALALVILCFHVASACMPQYERELRYLNYYMGIAPANEDGTLDVNAAGINKYVERASQLNCDLRSSCLWINAPTDGLLDSSEFYLFDKVDTKPFPIQIRPGNAHPTPGTLFLLAGNTTNEPQGAVLMSAPVLCQNSDGILTFEYWLYNRARIEVLLMRVNTEHGHLHVISRPPVDCHFLKTNALCRVEIRRSIEPFRFGIRAFALGDAAIGSFAMINGIHYEADVCGTYEQPKIFNGVPLTRRLRQTRPIRTASDLNCGASDAYSASLSGATRCLWAASAPSVAIAHSTPANAQWSVGNNTHLWETLVRTESRPDDEFLYQYIDPMADVALLPQLRSVLVPCTRTSSTLTFKYWLSAGVQAQLCTLDSENTVLSCVYLNDADAPGPIRVDVDAADNQPFRFAFSVIKFASSKGGIIALDEIKFNGRLCHEDDPATPEGVQTENSFYDGDGEEAFLSPRELNGESIGTFATPPRRNGARQYSSRIEKRRQSVLEALFRVQPLSAHSTDDNEESVQSPNLPTYSPTLDCDFDVDICAHWAQSLTGGDDDDIDRAFVARAIADGSSRVQKLFQRATVPTETPFPHLANEFSGYSAIAIFSDTPHVPTDKLTQLTGDYSDNNTAEFAILTSQPINCAHDARIIVSYYSNGDASLNVCAEQHCIAQRRPRGNLSVTVNARQPFRLRILALSGTSSHSASSTASRRRFAPTVAQRFEVRPAMERFSSRLPSNRRRRPFRYRYVGANHGTADSVEEQQIAAKRFPPFVIIKRIHTEGTFCRLDTPAELACRALSCDFISGSLCNYEKIRYGSSDTQFINSKGRGAIAQLSVGTGRRAILRSPHFQLAKPVDLRFDAALTTFGARLYICPGNFHSPTERGYRRAPAQSPNSINTAAADEIDVALETSCQLLLGPKLIGGAGRVERIRVSLDATVRRFAFVALHDAFDAFGDAHFLLRNVKIIEEDGDQPIC